MTKACEHGLRIAIRHLRKTGPTFRLSTKSRSTLAFPTLQIIRDEIIVYSMAYRWQNDKGVNGNHNHVLLPGNMVITANT
jgi:hypothetical protein